MKKKSNPKISVVMPVYNGEDYLLESVNSILNQTFRDFEFIIINDGSKDATWKILKKFRKKDSRILIINNKRNIGSAESLNKGLGLSRGKYIACFCADDISHPRRLEIESNYLDKNPHIFLVGSSGIFIDEEGKEIRRFRKYNDYKMLAWRLRKSCGILFPSIMFRNEKKFKFNKEFVPADDYHLYYELIKQGKNLTNISNFLVKVRIHSKNSSILNKKRQEEAVNKIINDFSGLEDKTKFLSKIVYSIKLFVHHLRTINEKRVK